MTDRAAVKQLISVEWMKEDNRVATMARRLPAGETVKITESGGVLPKSSRDDEKGSRPPWPEEKLISRIVPIYSKTVQVKGLICVGFIT